MVRNYTIGAKVTKEEKERVEKLVEELKIKDVSTYVRWMILFPEKIAKKKIRAWLEKHVLEVGKNEVYK